MTNVKQRTINEWLNWYKEHGGSEDLELHPDELIHFHPEHGFITYLYHDDILELHHMVGDGKYWQKFIKNMLMGMYNLKKIRAFTRRNPQAWIRKYDGHIRGYYMEADINELKI